MFVETTQRSQFPGFEFFGWGGIGALAEPKDWTRRKSSQKLHFGDQEFGGL